MNHYRILWFAYLPTISALRRLQVAVFVTAMTIVRGCTWFVILCLALCVQSREHRRRGVHSGVLSGNSRPTGSGSETHATLAEDYLESFKLERGNIASQIPSTDLLQVDAPHPNVDGVLTMLKHLRAIGRYDRSAHDYFGYHIKRYAYTISRLHVLVASMSIDRMT